LLEEPFPGISEARRQAAAFGAPWEEASTPFVVEVDGELLGHVGLLELPLRVAGHDVLAGGVHGVVTKASARRRGHFRAAIEALLDVADHRYETLVLTTLHPVYFEDFGFRVLPEHVFSCHRDRSPAPSTPPARRLDPGVDADRHLLHRLLASRAPVSDVLGIGPERSVWAFYEAGADLRYLEGHDVVVSAERVGTTLRLYDVVGADDGGRLDEIAPLDDIVGAWGAGIDRVVAFFSPDRLGAAFDPAPHDLDGGPDALEPGEPNTVLMCRGPFPGEGQPRMLPRAGRC
jgi:hypothetical protein